MWGEERLTFSPRDRGPRVYVAARRGGEHWSARCFAQDIGGGEDPATGSAAGPLGAYLRERTGVQHVVVDQGVARRLLDRLRAAGVGCEVALSTGLQGVREPRLEIGAVTVRGDAATARVRTLAANQNESTDSVELVRQGEDWRIASLGG